MWAFRKEFNVLEAAQSLVRSPPSLSSSEANVSDHSGDYITCSRYVSIPIDDPASDPLPSHWGAERHSPIAEYFVIGTRRGDVSIVDVSGRNRLVRHSVHNHNKKKQEALLSSAGGAGLPAAEDSAEVVALDVLGTIVASVAAGGGEGSCAQQRILVSFLYPNAGDNIVAIDAPQRQNAALGTSTKKKGASSSSKKDTAEQQQCVEFRSLLLWEGHPRWATQPGEERMLYLFAGTDEGTVLMYKIDVSSRSAWLHSYFAIAVLGTDGTANANSASSQAASSSSSAGGGGASAARRYTNPIYSLAIHDTNAERCAFAARHPETGAGAFHTSHNDGHAASGGGGGCELDAVARLADEGGVGGGDIHLLAGTRGRWACWPMAHVPWGSVGAGLPRAGAGAACAVEGDAACEAAMARFAVSTTTTRANGGSFTNSVVEVAEVAADASCSASKANAVAHERVIAARIAGARSVVRRVGAERLRGALVFVPFAPPIAKAIFTNEMARAADEAEKRGGGNAGDDASADAAKWFAKYDTVCSGAEVGTIMAATLMGSGGDWDKEVPMYQVEFPSLKKTVTWPAAMFDIVNTQTLFGKGDSTGGPVFALAPLGPRRFVSGGADGAVRVWEWGAPPPPAGGGGGGQPAYRLLHTGEGRHTDLVRCLCALRAPDIFVSGSHDGSLREWHIYDEPSVLLCQTTTLAVVPDASPSGSGGCRTIALGSSDGGLGIASMSLVHGRRGLAVSPLFGYRLRTFAFMEVSGCDLPPDMVFDGERTRVIAAPPPSASRNDGADGDGRVSSVDPIDAFLKVNGLQ